MKLTWVTHSFWILIIAVGLFASISTPIYAQDPITILRSDADYQFGQLIRFFLEVNSSETLVEATLFFNTPTLPDTPTITIEIEPSQQLELEQVVELNALRLQPFSTITFWWVLKDNAGDLHTIPEATFVYQDDRFKWQTLTRENTTIFWVTDDINIANTTLDIVYNVQPRLQTIVPAFLPQNLQIYLYPTASDLQAALRLTGYDWIGGHTSPELGVILIALPDTPTYELELRRTVPHELTHLLLYEAVGNEAYELMPAWFNEGLATYLELDQNVNQTNLVQTSVDSGQTLSFQSLCDHFPIESKDIFLAYAQSSSLIRYIQSWYGNHTLTDMITSVADGAGCESMVRRGIGISLNELDIEWQSSVRTKPIYQRILQENSGWFVLLIFGFVIMFLLLRPLHKYTASSSTNT